MNYTEAYIELSHNRPSTQVENFQVTVVPLPEHNSYQAGRIFEALPLGFTKVIKKGAEPQVNLCSYAVVMCQRFLLLHYSGRIQVL